MTTAENELLRVLDSLAESTLFCTAGKLMPTLPGLYVKGVGDIGVPVSAADAKRLIKQAAQAPYGRGEDTVVDTGVRRVWQLEPGQFSLRNSAWKPFVAGIVETVRMEFAIPQRVGGQLYKLLVYEKGSFFAPHRDSEKASGMFATLVVCLPSKHAGGTLIVTHDGQTRRIEFGGDARFHIQYAAFYADCQHEVTPVTVGYRICLVYNLSIARKKQPSAPASSGAVQAAVELLPQLFADESRDKLAIPLKHQYTEAALHPGELKGADRARVDVLIRAAERLDYQAFLALMTHHQSGSVDYGSLDYDPYRSRRRYYDYDDDEEGGEDDESDYSEDAGAEFEEVYEESMSLDHWLDARGRPQPFGSLSLDEGEIVSGDAAGDRPYRQEIHEATGNEGASMDRWYRQAVVVMWPRDRYFSILAGEGPGHAIPALEKLIAETRNPSADAGCAAFAAAIIDRWDLKGRTSEKPGDGKSLSTRMLKLLDRLGSAELAVRFVGGILPEHSDGSEGPALVGLIDRRGWAEFAEPLRRFFDGQTPEEYGRSLATPVTIFEALCCLPPTMSEERRSICLALAEELAQVFDRFNNPPERAWWAKENQRAGIVERVFRALAAIHDTARLDGFVSQALGDAKRYDLHTVLIPAVKALPGHAAAQPWARPAWERLRDHCLTQLRSRTAVKPEPPTDWARDGNIHCRCADCRELAEFLKNPKERVHRFPRRKELRQHLHRQIEAHQCDLTHVTVRSGSPQTLVCTKTQTSYERRLKQFTLDVGVIRELELLSGSGAVPAAPPKKSRRTKARPN